MRLGIILLTAILMAIAVTANAQENLSIANALNSSALKEIILSSTIKPETYILTLDMNQKIEITNVTETNKTDSQSISTRSFGVAALNLSAMAMKTALVTLAMPEGQEENASVLATEIYLMNDTMYMKVDGNWTRIMLAGPSLKTLWKQENEIERQREELNNSTITLLGYENISGIDCYKMKVIPNLKAYSAIEEGYNIGVQGSLADSPATSNLNLSILFNNTDISEIVWIAKDTLLPVKIDISMNMALSPEQLGIPPNEAGDLKMAINTSEIATFSGFNRSISIVLPEDARNAAAFPSSIFILGNSSSMNSTDINATQMQ
ncbi:MAG: hypothetical protein ACE14P_09165 [Methanotrichaceae archaeon]